MSDKREADKIVRNQLPQLLNPHKKQKIKNSEDMTVLSVTICKTIFDPQRG